MTLFPEGAVIRPGGGLREDLLGLGGGVGSGGVIGVGLKVGLVDGGAAVAAAAAAPEVLPSALGTLPILSSLLERLESLEEDLRGSDVEAMAAAKSAAFMPAPEVLAADEADGFETAAAKSRPFSAASFLTLAFSLFSSFFLPSISSFLALVVQIRMAIS